MLNLANNKLKDRGAAALAGSARLAGLTELDLDGNRIGHRGAEALLRGAALRG